MLRSSYVYASLAGLSLAALGATVATGCGSSSDTTPAPTPTVSKDPPTKPANGVKGDGAGQVAVVHIGRFQVHRALAQALPGA